MRPAQGRCSHGPPNQGRATAPPAPIAAGNPGDQRKPQVRAGRRGNAARSTQGGGAPAGRSTAATNRSPVAHRAVARRINEKEGRPVCSPQQAERQKGGAAKPRVFPARSLRGPPFRARVPARAARSAPCQSLSLAPSACLRQAHRSRWQQRAGSPASLRRGARRSRRPVASQTPPTAGGARRVRAPMVARGNPAVARLARSQCRIGARPVKGALRPSALDRPPRRCCCSASKAIHFRKATP